MLAEVGGTVIDADELAREVTGPGAPVLAGIRRRFGDGVFAADGALDRPALAELVFDDARALADLEALTHPLVRQLVDERLAAASREHVPFVVIEAIKLVEGGLAARCDEAWLVDCTPVNQRARLVVTRLGRSDMRSGASQPRARAWPIAWRLSWLPWRTAHACAAWPPMVRSTRRAPRRKMPSRTRCSPSSTNQPSRPRADGPCRSRP